jgi:hypothetical protein
VAEGSRCVIAMMDSTVFRLALESRRCPETELVPFEIFEPMTAGGTVLKVGTAEELFASNWRLSSEGRVVTGSWTVTLLLRLEGRESGEAFEAAATFESGVGVEGLEERGEETELAEC